MSVGTRVDIALDFRGPYAFAGERSVFHSSDASLPGVYLWTIRQDADGKHLIHYVGETTSLASRQQDHLIQILGLNYGIWDPVKARQGVSEPVWNGLWRERNADGLDKMVEEYQRIHEHVVPYLGAISIFFAMLPLDRVDMALRKHIEGCIGWNLRTNHPADKILYPDDNHIGCWPEKYRGDLLVTSPEPIRGLDPRIPY